MKVENMVSNKGNSIPNQFIIHDNENECSYFQSYNSMIVKKYYDIEKGYCVPIGTPRGIYLDIKYWDYSKTTSKYRNMFLDMKTQEIKKGIKEGSIILTNLN